MKLIIAGSTGFVATELIRQAVSNPAITSIIGLARRTTAIPQNTKAGADKAKFKSVVCENFEAYPENVKQELAGADACIWLIAITPSKLNTMPFEEARKICLDYMVTGLKTITHLPRESIAKPFKFIYVSGAKTERDPNKKPWILGDYSLMRGEAETRVLDYAKESKGAVEACIVKPGLIDAPGKMGLMMTIASTVGRSIIGLPKVDVSEIAATLLEQAVNGIEKDTLENDDLIRIGQDALKDM